MHADGPTPNWKSRANNVTDRESLTRKRLKW